MQPVLIQTLYKQIFYRQLGNLELYQLNKLCICRRACINCKLAPVTGGSALHNQGVSTLLDMIVKLLPSPIDRNYPHVQLYGDELCAFAFKIRHDKRRGRLTYARVYRFVVVLILPGFPVNKTSFENSPMVLFTGNPGNVICL
jgi:translation elongation factor EF-G